MTSRAISTILKAPAIFSVKKPRIVTVSSKIKVNIDYDKAFIEALSPLVWGAVLAFHTLFDDSEREKITVDAMVSLWEGKERLRMKKPGLFIMQTILSKIFEHLRRTNRENVIQEIIDEIKQYT